MLTIFQRQQNYEIMNKDVLKSYSVGQKELSSNYI